MHSSQYKVHGYKGAVNVLHNGDWSGDVTIQYQEQGVEGISCLPDGELKEVTVPGKLLVALALPVAKQFVMDKIVSGLEQVRVDE